MNLIVDALEGRGAVISCDLEFPVSTITWLHRGVRVNLIETVDGELRIEDLQRAMTDETAIICLSHVQYSNGFRIDLEELGRSKRKRVLVVDRKSTRLNSSHSQISYAVFCLKKKKLTPRTPSSPKPPV